MNLNDPQGAWDSESRKSPYSTVADPNADDYCEGCDQDVDYSDGSKHGKCGCDAPASPAAAVDAFDRAEAMGPWDRDITSVYDHGDWDDEGFSPAGAML